MEVEGVVRQVQGDVCVPEAEAVGIDNPFQGLRGVDGSGVTEGDVELGTGELGTIHQDGLLVEMDTLRREPQLLELAFDPQVVDKAVGIDLCLFE